MLITKQNWQKGTEPLVSICCITYNHENYIRDAIEGSLIQDTTFPVEILINDDASTDKTAEVIMQYEDKYPDIIFPIYQKENQKSRGVRPNPTFNFPRASGKYIALCEGDDYWTDPYKLQKQVNFLEKTPEYSMCFHNAIVKYMNEKRPDKLFSNLDEREYKGEEILREWTIPTASVVFKKEHLDYKLQTNKNFIYGDIVLFLQMAEKGKIWCIDEVMSVYRIHNEGMIKKNRNSISNRLAFIKHHEEIKKNFNGKYIVVEKEILSRSYIGLSKLQLRRLRVQFVISIVKGFLQSPKLFLKNFFCIYLKIGCIKT